MADDYLEEHSPADLYDTVLIPALNQAQTDAQAGKMPEERETAVRQTTEALLEDLRERPVGKNGSTPAVAIAPDAPPRVVVVPAKNETDEAAGRMLEHALALNGIASVVLPHRLLVQETLERVVETGASVVCISTLRPFAVMQARHLAKRLRARKPELRIVVGLWDAKKAPEGSRRHLENAADHVENTVVGMVGVLRGLCPPSPLVAPPSGEVVAAVPVALAR